MRAKPNKVNLKPLYLLIGLAVLILEIGSFSSYREHLPALLSDIFQFDYQQKNWSIIPKTIHQKPLSDTLKIDLSEGEFQAFSQEWNLQYKNKYRISGAPWIAKKDKHNARIKLLNGHQNKWQKAEIAMIGMLPDHHGNFERMSLKVNLKGDNRLLNKKAFSLVLPETRTFFVDQMANQAYKDLYGGIQINTRPVWVQFRKNKPVVMLLEDKFDKFLVEANERRESIIFEKGFLGHLRDIPGIEKEDLDWSCNATLKDSARQAQLTSFVSAAFNDTTNALFNYIDHHKTRGAWALGMVNGSWHHWVDINMHWYYNPVNHKFEPTIREVNIDPDWQLKGNLSTFENRKKAYQNYLRKIQTEIVKGRPNFLVSYAQWGAQHIPDFWEKLDAEVGNAARKTERLIPEYKEPIMPLDPIQMAHYKQNIDYLAQFTKALNHIPQYLPKTKQKYDALTISGTQTFSNITHHSKNTSVTVSPGTRIRFVGPKALWQINGAIHFNGTAQKPIVVEASPECAASIFIESQSKVVLEHVIFKGLSNLEHNIWKTPSAIAFHKTHDIRISHCTFLDNRRGDDYLNLFGCSQFTIEHCRFENIKSDAFDSDFSNGSVTHSLFNKIGNDGIDGSGSEIHIANCNFNYIQDKAVSSGEKSQFTITNSSIHNSEIGLVSKDKSTLQVAHTRIQHVRLSAAVFQKKPEYGPAKMKIDRDLNDAHYLIEEGSTINHYGDTLYVSKNVKDLLYGNEYGSATQK
jgi:hypothetical protein